MKTKLWTCAIVLCSMLSEAAAQSLLQGYIDSAVKNNPGLRSWQMQSKATEQRIEPSKTLDDPMLMGGIMNLPVNFNLNQEMMTMKQIGIQQNFSVGKKYAFKSAVAQKESDAEVYSVESQKLLLIKQVKQQYYDLYAATKKIETINNSVEIIKNYISIANTRYSTGLGNQQDILKSQLEMSRMQDDLIKMESDRSSMTAMFNTLLSRNISEPVIIPDSIPFEPVALEQESLMNEVKANNPELLSSKTMIGKDSTSALLAKTSKIPDFNAGIWYGQRSAMNPDGSKAIDVIGLSIALNIPLYSRHKQDPLIAESGFNLQKSKWQYKAMQNESELMVTQAMIEMDKDSKLVYLYEKQLIPQAEQNLNAGIIGYQQNKIDFMTLNDNFISLYNYRLMYYQAIADYMKGIATLEMLTAKNLINYK